MKPHYTFIASKNYKGGTTSGCVASTFECINTARTDPWSDGSAKLELAIYYGEPNRISRLKISGGVTSDLGSVSTGYSDRPVARAIKIKHAGLNLTGPESHKPQAASLTAGPGYDRINLERNNYGQY